MAGYIGYEAGYSFVGLDDAPDVDYPLAQLGVYRAPLHFDHLTGRLRVPPHIPPDSLPGAANEPASPAPATGLSGQDPVSATFGLDQEAYTARVETILEYLNAGDCYQINFTDAFELTGQEEMIELYLRLRRAQPTSYGAYLEFGQLAIASFSPELHFRVEGGELTTRPMKGTAKRGRTLHEDLALRAELTADPKNRAENVMIVDLLRNDMGKLCTFGSIKVRQLFEVEPFGKVLQMTSSIRGGLRQDLGLAEVFSSLFPSGSVTGAPKKRAMEIIRELESRPRGVYTGAIGYASPSGDMTFSVAIRTIVSSPSGTVLGAGSGIVVDSRAVEEYQECLLKAAFVREGAEPFQLLETMRLEDGVVCQVERHLKRMQDSAEYFCYPFDYAEATRTVSAKAGELPSGVHGLRLTLAHDGAMELTDRPLEAERRDLLRVALSQETVDSNDPFLYHKTSRRERQERAMATARDLGLADLLFVNERGELTEGAISNLFVEIDGVLLTPPVSSGLLPGIGRAHVLATDVNAREAVLRPSDLRRAKSVYLCSALRGMRRVGLANEPAVAGEDDE